MDQRELSLYVVGIGYPNADGSNRLFELKLCRPGEPIELRPEPKHEKDPNAVAVFSVRGQQLGYLPAERAPWIKQQMAAGYVAIFQGLFQHAAAIRVRFGGGEPTLPPERPAGIDPDPDFYPDPDPPEWGA